jgi:hypothetical protein
LIQALLRYRWVIATLLAAGASGCLMTGFEPLESDPSAGAGSSQAGDDGSGGMSQTFMGGQGGAGQGGGGAGGSGGTAGVDGARDAGAGSGGMIRPMNDGSVPMLDGGVVSPECRGKDDLDACEDGKFCTTRDYCMGGACIGGSPLSCGDECNTGTCNESQRSCELTPVPNDTECGFGFFDAFKCIDGRCSSPTMMCTEGGECTPSCTGGTCDVSCPNTDSCQPTCSDGSTCNVDCQGSAECKVQCESSTCAVQCQGSGTCDVDCTAGATCGVICTDASGCEETDCLDGSKCTLLCTEAEDCGFRNCWANEQQCPDGKVVCGGAECEE